MTGTTAHSPEPDDHWPAARHRDLLNGLSQHLDPDAGLRDIMLHADHAAFTGALGRHLDTPAGLAAILPPPPAAASRRTPGQPGTAEEIAAADPAARMALRRSPVTLAVILSDLTVRTLTIAEKADARALYLARDLATDLARDLHRARDLARLTPDLDIDLAFDLARNLDLDRTRELVSDLARAVNRALTLARDPGLDLDLDLAFDLARDLALDRTRDLALALVITPDRDLARDLARQTALMMGGTLGLRQVEGLADALLEGALDDFTHADLTRTDLAGSDMTGIRWSDRGTTWPPGTDTDGLRARSQEIAPGIYEITRPGHDDKARHHTPA